MHGLCEQPVLPMKGGKHAVMTIPCNQFSGWILSILDAATKIRMEQDRKGFVEVNWIQMLRGHSHSLCIFVSLSLKVNTQDFSCLK